MAVETLSRNKKQSDAGAAERITISVSTHVMGKIDERYNVGFPMQGNIGFECAVSIKESIKNIAECASAGGEGYAAMIAAAYSVLKIDSPGLAAEVAQKLEGIAISINPNRVEETMVEASCIIEYFNGMARRVPEALDIFEGALCGGEDNNQMHRSLIEIQSTAGNSYAAALKCASAAACTGDPHMVLDILKRVAKDTKRGSAVVACAMIMLDSGGDIGYAMDPIREISKSASYGRLDDKQILAMAGRFSKRKVLGSAARTAA